MDQDQIKSIFDQQAAGYDKLWAKTAPIKECLHLLLDAMFAELPADARVLCVGVGTGVELLISLKGILNGALRRLSLQRLC